MKRTALDGFHCSVAQTLDVIGEWWTPLVLRDLFLGLRRFEELAASLGIARNVLTDRLATLVEHGVVTRQPYSERPPRYEYVLTEKGRELAPVLVALMDWGDKWVYGGEQPATAEHRGCGGVVHAPLTCSACGAAPAAADVAFRPSAAAIESARRQRAAR